MYNLHLIVNYWNGSILLLLYVGFTFLSVILNCSTVKIIKIQSTVVQKEFI